MSPLGQSRRFGDGRASSALALKADIRHKARHVSKVPSHADIVDQFVPGWWRDPRPAPLTSSGTP